MNITVPTKVRPQRYPSILALLPTLAVAGVLALAGLSQATTLDAGTRVAPAPNQSSVESPTRAMPTMAIYLVDSQAQADQVHASRVSLEGSAASYIVLIAGTPADEERANLALSEISDAWDREGHSVYVLDLRTPR